MIQFINKNYHVIVVIIAVVNLCLTLKIIHDNKKTA